MFVVCCRRPRAGLIALLVAALVTAAQPAFAGGLIRDAEVENTIRAFATPIFRAAGLSPGAVRVRLIDDSAINAFVAGGQNLFMNTGLIMKADHAGQVIGVIAHEAGHISGGHLARIHQRLSTAGVEQILALVAGLAAGALTGRGDVGIAAMSAATSASHRSILSYSRAHESAADQAALRYLDRTRQSARGLAEFFDVLADQELLSPTRRDPYLSTHPLTRERVDTVKAHIAQSPWSDVPPSPAQTAAFDRMKAKLIGYLEPSGRVFRLYPDSDTSIAGRYARAVAYMRLGDLDQALNLIDGLLAEAPRDPYFHELKAEILTDGGRIDAAMESWQTAVSLAPGEPLIRTGLAEAQLASGNPALTKAALGNLGQAVNADPENAHGWRLLGQAYAASGQTGDAALAYAHFALLRGDLPTAKTQVAKALHYLPEGDRARLTAQDLEREIERIEERRN